MTRYTDLSINVRAAWNRQHMLNGAYHVKHVPAWVCRVTRNEGYDDVLNEVEFTLDQVEQVARLIDSFGLGASVLTAVRMSQSEIREDLQRQLEAAETAARRIPDLKAAIASEEAPDG